MPHNKKMGRPLKNDLARTESLKIRLTTEEKNKIQAVADKMKKSKADTIVFAIERLSETLE